MRRALDSGHRTRDVLAKRFLAEEADESRLLERRVRRVLEVRDVQQDAAALRG